MGIFFTLMAGAAIAIGLAAVFIPPIVFVTPAAKPHISFVAFTEGSAIDPHQIEPKEIRVTIGMNNTVRWINQDLIAHTVISDADYMDPASGLFSSFAPGYDGIIPPGQAFEFTFTQPGIYDYHMEPHPWMSGTVIVDPPTL